MFVLWEESHLADVCLIRCGRDVIVVKNQLELVAKFLRTVSEKADIVSFGGVSVEVSQSLDKMTAS